MDIWALLLDSVRSVLFGLSHLFGGNVGVGIIALSMLTRVALLPWSLRAARRSRQLQVALKKMEPRLRELKAKHAKDPVRLRDATFAEYKKAGVSPFGGMSFGLMAVQIPLGWALYSVISTGLGSGGAFLWIANLAHPDTILSVVVGGLSTLMAATVPNTNGTMSPLAVAGVMGLVAGFFVFHLSAGVGLYWASTSSVGILQNLVLRRTSSEAL